MPLHSAGSLIGPQRDGTRGGFSLAGPRAQELKHAAAIEMMVEKSVAEGHERLGHHAEEGDVSGVPSPSKAPSSKVTTAVSLDQEAFGLEALA